MISFVILLGRLFTNILLLSYIVLLFEGQVLGLKQEQGVLAFPLATGYD
jgi:hypothetical protein